MSLGFLFLWTFSPKGGGGGGGGQKDKEGGAKQKHRNVVVQSRF